MSLHPSRSASLEEPVAVLSAIDRELSKTSLYLLLRARFFRSVVLATDLRGLGQADVDEKFELIGNVFSRFYLTARNERVPFVDACRTVATELRERNLAVPREMRKERDGRNLGVAEDDAVDVVARSPEEFLSLFDDDGLTGSPPNDVEAALAKLRGIDPSDSDRSFELDERAALLCEVLPSARVVVATDAGTEKVLVSYEFSSGGDDDCTVPKLTLSVDEEKHDELLRRSEEWLTTRMGAPRDDRKGGFFIAPAFLVRVTAFSYLPASGFLYWGFGPDVYRYAAEELHARFEWYANPFNRTLEKFCSPFELDGAYGSLGSLYGVDWTDVPELAERKGTRRGEGDSCSGGQEISNCAASSTEQREISSRLPVDSLMEDNFVTLIANPPYIATEIELCAQTIRKLLHSLQRGTGAKNVLVLSIGPAWYKSKGIRTMQNGVALPESENADVVGGGSHDRRRIRKVLERELAPEEQRYYNYQTLESVPATHPGVAFAFSNFEVTAEIVDRIEHFFKHMGSLTSV